MIAHRLSTVVRASSIIVLSNGLAVGEPTRPPHVASLLRLSLGPSSCLRRAFSRVYLSSHSGIKASPCAHAGTYSIQVIWFAATCKNEGRTGSLPQIRHLIMPRLCGTSWCRPSTKATSAIEVLLVLRRKKDDLAAYGTCETCLRYLAARKAAVRL